MLTNDNNDNNQIIINEIKKKLDVMAKSKYRTTHFSLIEYFADNNFQPINISFVIIHLVSDYKSNPKKYVLCNENSHFKSEKTFENSIKYAIKKNKSFKQGPEKGQLSLNFSQTLEYLETMFNKYKNNSKDIKTPIKLSGRKRHNENKRQESFNIKCEKNEDDSDYEINSYKRKKNNKIDFHTPKKANNTRKTKYNGFKKEKDYQNKIFDIKDSDSDSYQFSDYIKKEVKKEDDYNSEWIPDIFCKNLDKTNLISSININVIANSVNSIKYYLQYIDDNDDLNNISRNEEIGEINKKLEEIKNYLINLSENKNSYDILCDEVKNWQKEIYFIYKVMQNQFNDIKIEINNKTYSYDAYIKLRDIIFNYEAKYDKATDSLISKLNEIMQLDKNSLEKQLFIRRLLKNLNIKKKLINSIENAARINDVLSFNQVIFGNFPNYNCQNDRYYMMNVEEIRKDFENEKVKIIDALYDIDTEIGNISI